MRVAALIAAISAAVGMAGCATAGSDCGVPLIATAERLADLPAEVRELLGPVHEIGEDYNHSLPLVGFNSAWLRRDGTWIVLLNHGGVTSSLDWRLFVKDRDGRWRESDEQFDMPICPSR